MCTVTFIPLGNNDFILTSNRDEDPNRKTTPPQKYLEDGVELMYPKDTLAGGTWIGFSDQKRLICLLNGGFVKHKRQNSYKMSRGVIVKKLLKVVDAVTYITDLDLIAVEPFTIVLVDWQTKLKAYELVWDGARKHFKELENAPQIWSSSTLYTAKMKKLREQWFADWLTKNNFRTNEAIMTFHTDETKGNAEVSLKMKRANVQTVSVTSVEKKAAIVKMEYVNV